MMDSRAATMAKPPSSRKSPRVVRAVSIVMPERYQLSITGRNTQYGYPANVCQTVPPA